MEDFNKRSLVYDSEDDCHFYSDNGEDDSEPLNLYSLSSRPGTCLYKRFDIGDISQQVLFECIPRMGLPRMASHNEFWRMTKVIHVTRSPFLPTDQAWILRNLTTKEFVTSGVIALDAKFIHGPFIQGIGFGEVVVSRSCWTSSFTHMCYEGHIRRGVWAGHRLDITTRGRHDESTKDEEGEWKDVSVEVAAEIAAIWESKYGPNWREYVIRRAEVKEAARTCSPSYVLRHC